MEADAVYAANGYGLCVNYYNPFECTDEFEELPNSHVFTIFYSRHVLYTSIIAPISGEALSRFNWDEAQLLDFEVGLDRLLHINESDGELLSRIRSQLLVLPREYPYPLTHILLAGESVTHPRFLAILREALAEMESLSPANIQTNIPDHGGSAIASKMIDPTFAASRGAALYARRRQEVQPGCTELSECEEMRKRERAGLPLKNEL
ncbi:hypothetical protein Plec18170_007501 [Paecilomyces lecythidis]